MAHDLLDITVTPKEVDTHKYGKVNVHGLSMTGIAHIIKNHPQIFEIMDKSGTMKMDMQQVVDLGEEVVSDFLAAGLGYPGDAKAVAKCKAMNPEDAMTIGAAILEETFPGGATNFIQRVAAKIKEANVMEQVSKLSQIDQVQELETLPEVENPVDLKQAAAS